MKKTILLLFVLFLALNSLCQSFVGEHKLTIKKMMKEQYTDFYFAKEVIASKQNFIKYEDFDELRTWLFVLDKEGYCQYTVLMMDYSLLKSSIDSLNTNYEYKGDLTWADYVSGKDNYIIKIKKKDWFFSIVTRVIDESELKKLKKI